MPDYKAKKVLGWKLMLARKARRTDQKQAADAVGVHPQTVSNWERGVKEPTFSAVVALAHYYGVDLAWLADPRESMPEGGKL